MKVLPQGEKVFNRTTTHVVFFSVASFRSTGLKNVFLCLILIKRISTSITAQSHCDKIFFVCFKWESSVSFLDLEKTKNKVSLFLRAQSPKIYSKESFCFHSPSSSGPCSQPSTQPPAVLSSPVFLVQNFFFFFFFFFHFMDQRCIPLSSCRSNWFHLYPPRGS